MKVYDVIIVGAGPAGLFTAINCSNKNRNVLILEKNSSPGKKLLISGSGQCNITHAGDIRDFFNHYGEKDRFLKHALLSYTNMDVKKFFEDRGLNLIRNEKGKLFPETLKASDILNILLEECRKKEVAIKYKESVTEVKCNENNIFHVGTDNSKYESKILVIATGGKSYPVTGSSGDGYVFAESLGHTVVKPLPALTPLYIKDYPFKELTGISFEDIPVSLWRNGKKVRIHRGDVLFTHRGISGPGILNMSRYVKKGDVIKLNLLGIDNEEKFRRDFAETIGSKGKLLVKTVLREFPIPKRVADKILEISNISWETQCSQLSKDKRNLLIKLLLEFPMIVEELGGYHLAMATRGGVCLKEINSKTMESKIVKGLYFVGEVLDIDGDTGGYNIQAAFSTGALAGKAIVKELKNN